MNRSRLSRRNARKTKKNLLLSILGIIFIIFIIFKFGIPLLLNVSLFLSGSRNSNDVGKQNSLFIAPPILDSFPQATSSANIIISGIASKEQKINLYINGELIDKTIAEDDGRFMFSETIKPGEINIKAKAIVNEKESGFSNTIVTVYKSSPPSLSIDFPSDNQSFSKDQNIVKISGSTDSEVRVTINGLWAIADNYGNFSYNFSLQNGENKIKIIATDLAGNTTEKELKINYSQ